MTGVYGRDTIASPESNRPSAPAEAVTTSTGERTPMASLATEAREITDGGNPDIFVDVDAKSQEIYGFGAAVTHSSAQLISAMAPTTRASLLEELFAPDGPMRLSMIRIPIGASDFTPTDAFTFDDLPAGETDWDLEHFDIGTDRAAMIPVLQEISAISPRVRIIASPWSPPAWLKTNGSLEGGRLLDEDRAYETYSAYLIRFIEEYARAGLDIDFLTVQNEPQLRNPDGYPGTDMPVWQAAKLIEKLGPGLAQSGLRTAILGFDHNWELNPADAATTPPSEDPAYEYPADLLRTDAARWIAGTAFHCYYGNADRQSQLREQFPEKTILVTECSGSGTHGDSQEKVFVDTLSWQATNLLINPLRNHASAVLTWNLALDEFGGPHRGGCETCSGVVTISTSGEISRNAEYALLGHAARFVPSGSRRVDSFGTEELSHVAFRDPNGVIVLIVWNPTSSDYPVQVGDGQHNVNVELPAGSLSTISWGGGEH
ncbi:glycoside hydrolase family 30 beta sandwich domain-containing protein [Agromyces sp. Soil535]|uniref:glycoside hydrolase family 30 protein n=1 Tax=Agromyces sp. Soil535 TaxID=1736390 RepID=UPI00138EE23A|nr:glycoside hydrolase family 30 beta sandwich domain-containing protein [Agromyces sp. Soil535]